ncbi:MAG: hypothetical protein J0H41_06030 [Rhizobiales bacterium]|nr:hypothetical protein [Hyphomicrobiales bacterium]
MANAPIPKARVFHVETQLHMQARASGGVSRAQAVKAASMEVDKLKPAFDEWLGQEIAFLVEAVERAKQGAPCGDWLDVAMIHCRQLHDVGGTMGCELVTLVADLLYKTFEGVAGGAECRLDTIVCYVDALQLVSKDDYRAIGPDQTPDLVAGLRKMAEHVNGVAM